MSKVLKKSLAAIITVALSTAALSTAVFAESKSKKFGVGTTMATAYLSVSGNNGTATTSIDQRGGSVSVSIQGKYFDNDLGKYTPVGNGNGDETTASAGISKPTSTYWIYVKSEHSGSYDGSRGSTSLEIKL